MPVGALAVWVGDCPRPWGGGRVAVKTHGNDCCLPFDASERLGGLGRGLSMRPWGGGRVAAKAPANDCCSPLVQ